STISMSAQATKQRETVANPDGVFGCKVHIGNLKLTDFTASQTIEGLLWDLRVYLVSIGERERHFADLSCAVKSTLWNCSVDAELIVSNTNAAEDLRREATHTFSQQNNKLLFSNVENIKTLENTKGFLENGAMDLEIRLFFKKWTGIRKTHAFRFDVKDSRSDLGLIVEGHTIYVSKSILSLYSPVFDAMIHGGFLEEQKEEIEVKNVGYEDFLELMHVIYPTHHPVNDLNVEAL
ncbi:hypothetical protein PFISCL1PPCAC_21959, partial [Pristionchus fissidentatus]